MDHSALYSQLSCSLWLKFSVPESLVFQLFWLTCTFLLHQTILILSFIWSFAYTLLLNPTFLCTFEGPFDRGETMIRQVEIMEPLGSIDSFFFFYWILAFHIGSLLLRVSGRCRNDWPYEYPQPTIRYLGSSAHCSLLWVLVGTLKLRTNEHDLFIRLVGTLKLPYNWVTIEAVT